MKSKLEEVEIKKIVKWYIPNEIKLFYVLMTPLLVSLYIGVVFNYKEILFSALAVYLVIFAFVCFATFKLCREVKYKIIKNRKIFKLEEVK